MDVTLQKGVGIPEKVRKYVLLRLNETEFV